MHAQCGVHIKTLGVVLSIVCFFVELLEEESHGLKTRTVYYSADSKDIVIDTIWYSYLKKV